MIPPKIDGLTPTGYQQLKAWMMTVEAELGKKAPVIASMPTVQAVYGGNHRTMLYSLAADLTLTWEDMNCVHYINCTSAANITLPGASEGCWVRFINVGAQTFTVNATIASVPTGSYVDVATFSNSSFVPEWPSAVPVMSKAGVLTTAASGLAIKSANGHFWIITVDNTGAFVLTDNGTVPPV